MSSNIPAGPRVLDLSRTIAGGYCTSLLARLGADVVRVEPVEEIQQPNRQTRPHWAYIHAGKRSVTLNAASSDGMSLWRKLARHADALVVDIDPPERLLEGVGDDGDRPTVIVSIEGVTGGCLGQRENELMLWARSGLLHLGTGTGAEPVLPSGYPASYQVGVHAAVATMAAVLEAQSCAIGGRVEIDALEVLARILSATSAYDSYAATGECSASRGVEEWPARQPWLVQVADGHVLVNLNSVYLRDFLAFVTAWDLVDDQPGRDPEATCRMAVRTLHTWSKTQFVERAQLWRLPAGAVLTIEDLKDDEQLAQRGTMVSLDDPQMGAITIPWLPWTSTSNEQRRAAPRSGQHNDDVYRRWLGIGAHSLERLAVDGVV